MLDWRGSKPAEHDWNLSKMIAKLNALRKKSGFVFARIPQSVRGTVCNFLWLALSAGAAALFGELMINAIYYGKFKWHFAGALAVFGNILILFCLFLIMLVIVNRKFVAIALGSTLYGILILSDILKLRSFDNPVRLTDLQYLPDLKVIAMASLGFVSIASTLAVAAAIIVAIILFWRREKRVLRPIARILTGVGAAALLVSFFVVPSYPGPREWLNDHGIDARMVAIRTESVGPVKWTSGRVGHDCRGNVVPPSCRIQLSGDWPNRSIIPGNSGLCARVKDRIAAEFDYFPC